MYTLIIYKLISSDNDNTLNREDGGPFLLVAKVE